MNITDRSQPAAAEDFRPAASLETLRQRAALLAALRQHFEESGYWEVETPLLSRDTVVDAWLEPFHVSESSSSPQPDWFLQTSPEFGMKRLLASGAEAIYQITRAFRKEETGRLHNPEFTIVEWYKAGDTYHDQMTFVEELTTAIFRLGGQWQTERSGGETSAAGYQPPEAPFERITYRSAFERHAGVDAMTCTCAELAEMAERRGLNVPETLRRDDRDGWLNLLLAELVEPHLGRGRPAFLYDYPASQAALARLRADEPAVAERFELYVEGVEVCNGYQELTDVDELRRRMLRQSEIRRREGLPDLPLDNRLEAAMQAGLPECAGVALGFDRLAMLALGKRSIGEVMAFPGKRA